MINYSTEAAREMGENCTDLSSRDRNFFSLKPQSVLEGIYPDRVALAGLVMASSVPNYATHLASSEGGEWGHYSRGVLLFPEWPIRLEQWEGRGQAQGSPLGNAKRLGLFSPVAERRDSH